MTESPNIDATLLTSSSLSPSLSRLGLELDTVSDFVASMVFLCLRKFVRLGRCKIWPATEAQEAGLTRRLQGIFCSVADDM